MSKRVPLLAGSEINKTCKMDTGCDKLFNGQRLETLTIADDYGIGGEYATRVLDRVTLCPGYTKVVRTARSRSSPAAP